MNLMPDFISTSVSSFSQFLSEQKVTLKNNSNSCLISCKLNAADNLFEHNLASIINNFEKSFYFEKPSDQFFFVGFDEVISISEKGDGRFSTTEKKINEWKENFLSNWNSEEKSRIPLFVGSMKFMVEHSDEDWKEFNDSDWFVPEFVFIKLKNECSIIYNFLRSANQKNEKIIERFKLKLENIFNLINSEKENCNSFKILNESGTSPKDKKKWKQNVQSALEEIQNKIIDKIVLSRKVEFILSEKPSVENFIEQLKVKFPRCYIFIVHCRESTFIGATPEKLANFENGNVELDALAGSAPRGKNVDEDNSLEKDLLANKKNLNEHNFVVNHIKDIISKHNYEDLNTTEITVRKLANIQHLLTKFSVKLNHDSSIFSILKELSPTPAVCGIPLQSSMQLIKKLESHKRGLYSGFIGWLNFENEGEFAVSIRSALINNKKIIAYAGSGIVEDSDPELEFNETDLKLNTILNLLRNENKN